MPKQRRSLACQHCKRLKTRCEVLPDAVTCLRCKSLRHVDWFSIYLYLADEARHLDCNVRSQGNYEVLLAMRQSLTLTVISRASLAVEGKSETCLQYVLLPHLTDSLQFEQHHCVSCRGSANFDLARKSGGKHSSTTIAGSRLCSQTTGTAAAST